MSRAWGSVTTNDFLDNIEYVRQQFANGSIDSDWGQLVDFREVTSYDLNSDEIRQLALLNPWPPRARRVMILNNDHAFGIARMYQLVGGNAGDNIELVSTEEEALAWLQR